MKIIEIDSKTYRKNISYSFAKLFLNHFTVLDIYINSFLSLIYDHTNQ